MSAQERLQQRLKRTQSNAQGFRSTFRAAVTESGKTSLRRAKSVFGLKAQAGGVDHPPTPTTAQQSDSDVAPSPALTFSSDYSGTSNDSPPATPRSPPTDGHPDWCRPDHETDEAQTASRVFGKHNTSQVYGNRPAPLELEPQTTLTHDSNNNNNRPLRSKSSLASLGKFIGSLWSPPSPSNFSSAPTSPDMPVPNSPYSCESSASSLDSLDPDVTSGDISFDTEQLSRLRAAEWVEATKPPSQTVRQQQQQQQIPAQNIYQRRHSFIATVGLGIDALSFPPPDAAFPSPRLASSPPSSAAGPLVCTKHARPQPMTNPAAPRSLRHFASVPILRQALHFPDMSSSASTSSSSASTTSGSIKGSPCGAKQPRLLRKAKSYAAMRSQPLQPFLTLQEDLVKCKRTVGTPEARSPAQKETASSVSKPLTRKEGPTRTGSAGAPCEPKQIVTRNRSETSASNQKKKACDKENNPREAADSKAQRSLKQVLASHFHKPSQPFDVGIVPPAGVARQPKPARMSPVSLSRGKSPMRLARSPLTSPIPSIVIEDFSDRTSS